MPYICIVSEGLQSFSSCIISLNSFYNVKINTINSQLEKLRFKGFTKTTPEMAGWVWTWTQLIQLQGESYFHPPQLSLGMVTWSSGTPVEEMKCSFPATVPQDRGLSDKTALAMLVSTAFGEKQRAWRSPWLPSAASQAPLFAFKTPSVHQAC